MFSVVVLLFRLGFLFLVVVIIAIVFFASLLLSLGFVNCFVYGLGLVFMGLSMVLAAFLIVLTVVLALFFVVLTMVLACFAFACLGHHCGSFLPHVFVCIPIAPLTTSDAIG